MKSTQEKVYSCIFFFAKIYATFVTPRFLYTVKSYAEEHQPRISV